MNGHGHPLPQPLSRKVGEGSEVIRCATFVLNGHSRADALLAAGEDAFFVRQATVLID